MSIIQEATVYEHLINRRLTPEKYKGICIDEANKTATFLLWNLSGQIVGFQQYKPFSEKSGLDKPSDQRYFTIVSKESPRTTKIAVFGTELINYSQKVLFISEGIFDVSPLHQRSINAIAVLCNNPKPLEEWLNTLNFHIIALCEGDDAGKKLASVADEYIILPDNEDPADQNDIFFDNLINKYC